LWSHSITAIGAGLGTVVTNLQVLIVSLLAWLILGERPRRSLMLASPVMLAGLALVGGLAGGHAYGTDPSLGVGYGAGVAVLYSVYILLLRQATSPGKADDRPAAVAGVLFEATAGAVAGSVVLGLVW
jgi:drug/metabolite transporter (DMT)-like permease